MLFFTAPYEDREKILKLGAEWDFARWAWKVVNPRDYRKFSPWVSGTTIADELYIIEAVIECHKCHKPARVVALGVGEYTENFAPDKKGANCINLLYGFENIGAGIAEYLVGKYPLKKRYLPAVGYKLRVNGCSHCDAIIPDEYLFIETSSPFYIDSPERADKLKVSRFAAGFDFSIDAIVTCSVDRSLFSREFEKIDNLQVF